MYRIVYPLEWQHHVRGDRSALTVVREDERKTWDFASSKSFQDYDAAYAYAKRLAQLYGLSLHTPTAILD